MKNNKIYARQIAPEYQSSPLEYCDMQDLYPDFIVTGNRDYKDFTTPEYEAITKYADHLYEAIFLDEYKHEFKNTTEAIQYYFPVGNYHKGKTKWNTRQVHLFQWAVGNYYVGETKTSVCALLSLLTGKEYACCSIRGSCQSEWNYCYYPKENAEDVKRLESDFFNTGTEWIVHDDDTPPETPEDISGYSIYCYEWRTDLIKKEIADYTGATPENVTLYEFDGYHKTTKYKEI